MPIVVVITDIYKAIIRGGAWRGLWGEPEPQPRSRTRKPNSHLEPRSTPYRLHVHWRSPLQMDFGFEQKHPRAPGGTAHGGEFTKKLAVEPEQETPPPPSAAQRLEALVAQQYDLGTTGFMDQLRALRDDVGYEALADAANGQKKLRRETLSQVLREVPSPMAKDENPLLPGVRFGPPREMESGAGPRTYRLAPIPANMDFDRPKHPDPRIGSLFIADDDTGKPMLKWEQPPAQTPADPDTHPLLPGVQFGPPKRVNTRNGERDLLTARPNEAFWDKWRANKERLKAAGISASRDQMTGNWQIQWWRPVSAEEKQERQEAREASRATSADLDIPKPEGLQYLPFQKAGIAYGLQRKNVLIADEMGLGKTIQAIGIANADPTARKILVICPASLKVNWQREFEKWDTKGLSVGIARKEFPATDVAIINYDVLKKFRPEIDKQKWDMMIADEAHYLKNSKAQRTQLVLGGKTMAPIQATRRVFMTGTPIVNRPAELWPFVHALDPEGLGKSWFAFHKRYAGGVETRYGWDVSGATNLPELQDKLRERMMIRRLKSEVVKELPAKQRQVIALDADNPTVKRLLNKEREEWAPKEAELQKLKAQAELARASGNEPEYRAAVERLEKGADVAFTDMAAVRHEIALAKAPQVAEHVKELLESTDKVLVFAWHRDVVQKIMDDLGDQAVRLTGDMSDQARQKSVDRFQTDPTCRVFVGNIQAAGVGLTLTAAHTVVFGELNWTPASMAQAEDRAHRIGQKDQVLIQHLVYDGSLDSHIAQTLVDKQRIIDEALDTEHAREAEADARIPVLPGELVETEQPTMTPTMTPDQTHAVHEGLRMLAGMDPDRARERNDVGFNAFDGEIGHSLAGRPELSPKQAALGAKVLRKYSRQLGPALHGRIFGTPVAKSLPANPHRAYRRLMRHIRHSTAAIR